MFMLADDPNWMPLLKDWGTAGILIAVLGMFSLWILPKLLTISNNFKIASDKLESISTRAENVVTRAEILCDVKPKSGMMFHPIPPQGNPNG